MTTPAVRLPTPDDLVPYRDSPFAARWAAAGPMSRAWRHACGALSAALTSRGLFEFGLVHAAWADWWLQEVFYTTRPVVTGTEDAIAVIRAAQTASRCHWITDANATYLYDGPALRSALGSLLRAAAEVMAGDEGAEAALREMFPPRTDPRFPNAEPLATWRPWRDWDPHGFGLPDRTDARLAAILVRCSDAVLDAGVSKPVVLPAAGSRGFFEGGLNALHAALNECRAANAIADALRIDNAVLRQRVARLDAMVHEAQRKELQAKPAVERPLGDPIGDDQPAHADDFSWVRCHLGKSFDFTARQRPVVRALWDDWSRGGSGLSQNHLLTVSGSDSKRLSNLFNQHPAWNTLIVRAENIKGGRRLNLPPHRPTR
jgi:hypothetical protein